MPHLSIWWCPAIIYFWSYHQIFAIFFKLDLMLVFNYDVIIPLPAHRAILRWARQEELQQLQNVPVVPTRLRRGELRGRAGPPHPVLPRRLRQPSAPIQSQHQLRGLLLHHAEAFKQGEQVHRLPRLLGVKKKKTRRTPCTLSLFPWVCALCGCAKAWGCMWMCVHLCWNCTEWPGLGLAPAAFD